MTQWSSAIACLVKLPKKAEGVALVRRNQRVNQEEAKWGDVVLRGWGSDGQCFQHIQPAVDDFFNRP